MSLSSDKLPIGFLTVQSRQAATLGGGRQVGNQTKNYRAKAHGLGHALCVHQFHMSTRTYTSVLKSQEEEPRVQRADTTCLPPKSVRPTHLMPLPSWRERM